MAINLSVCVQTYRHFKYHMMEVRLIALTDVWLEASLGKTESSLNVSSDIVAFLVLFFGVFLKKLNLHFSLVSAKKTTIKLMKNLWKNCIGIPRISREERHWMPLGGGTRIIHYAKSHFPWVSHLASGNSYRSTSYGTLSLFEIIIIPYCRWQPF